MKKKNAITKSEKVRKKTMRTQTKTYVSHFTIHTLYFWFHSLVFLLWYPLRLDGLFLFWFFCAPLLLSVLLGMCVCVCARTTLLWLFARRYSMCSLARTHAQSMNCRSLSVRISFFFFQYKIAMDFASAAISVHRYNNIMSTFIFMWYKNFHSSKKRLSLLPLTHHRRTNVYPHLSTHVCVPRGISPLDCSESIESYIFCRITFAVLFV